jgi:hypothetical protein
MFADDEDPVERTADLRDHRVPGNEADHVPHVNLGKQHPANYRSLGALDKEVGTAMRMPDQIRCRVAVTSHYPVAP